MAENAISRQDMYIHVYIYIDSHTSSPRISPNTLHEFTDLTQIILSISVKNHNTRKQHAANCVDERSLKTAESKTSRGVCDKEEEIVEEEVEVGE